MKKLIFLLTVLVIVNSGTLFAGLSVDPVVLETLASKDKETTDVFKVLNTGSNQIHIRVSPEKWKAGNANINTWLLLEPMDMDLSQNETKEVRYKITPQKDASGELRCMVFFIADEVGENRSNVGIRFGVPIYAIVSGTEIIDVVIDDIELRYSENTLTGSIIVNNKSNIHIRPNIDINILNSRDKLITKFSIPFGQPAQAKETRSFMYEQNIELKPGKYKFIANVDYGRLYGLEYRVLEKRTAFVVK